jgi:hypothetical protein
MDQDDIALPQRFEKQLQQLKKNNADICGTWIKYFGNGYRHKLKTYVSDEAIKIDMLFNSPFAHPSVVMRTALLKELMYDINYDKAEDYDLWVRAALANWKMTNVPEVLLEYRIHGAQTTRVEATKILQTRKKIQKKYWAHVSSTRALGKYCTKQALDLTINDHCLHVDQANVAFLALLKSNEGEAKQALINNISRVYLNAAYWHAEVRSMWDMLAAQNLGFPRYSMKIKLLILRIFKVRNGSKKYLFLKKIYNFFR